MKTVVIDPRFTPDAAKADVWLPIRPGTDVAMTDGWARYIIENKLYDEAWCVQWTNLPFLVDTRRRMLALSMPSELGLGEATRVTWCGTQTDNSAKAMPWPQDETLSPACFGAYEFEVNGKKSRTAFRAAVGATCAEWTLEKDRRGHLVHARGHRGGREASTPRARPIPASSIGVATDQ